MHIDANAIVFVIFVVVAIVRFVVNFAAKISRGIKSFTAETSSAMRPMNPQTSFSTQVNDPPEAARNNRVIEQLRVATKSETLPPQSSPPRKDAYAFAESRSDAEFRASERSMRADELSGVGTLAGRETQITNPFSNLAAGSRDGILQGFIYSEIFGPPLCKIKRPRI